jgi:hypothetical protein
MEFKQEKENKAKDALLELGISDEEAKEAEKRFKKLP